MAKRFDFNQYRQERQQQTQVEPIEFAFGYYSSEHPNFALRGQPKWWTIYPQLSFGMTRIMAELHDIMTNHQQSELEDNPTLIGKVMNDTGEVLEGLMGREKWLELQSEGFGPTEAINLLQALGDEYARHQEHAEEEDEGAEPSAEDAPGEDSGKKSPSQQTTSSPTGQSSRPMRGGFMMSQPENSSS